MKSVCPGELSSAMEPWCALTTAETIARPKPVLPPLREREVSPRANRSNTSDCSCSGMPGPLSRTLSTACVPSDARLVVTTVPAPSQLPAVQIPDSMEEAATAAWHKLHGTFAAAKLARHEWEWRRDERRWVPKYEFAPVKNLEAHLSRVLGPVELATRAARDGLQRRTS